MVRIFVTVLWNGILCTFFFLFIYVSFIIDTVWKGVALLCAAAADSLVSVRCSCQRSSTHGLAGGVQRLIASSRLETAKCLSASRNFAGSQ